MSTEADTVILRETNRAGSATFSLLGIGLLALVACRDGRLDPSGNLDPSKQGDGDEGGDGDSMSSDASEFPCGVETIVRSKCELCHSEFSDYSAPMSLTSAADFRANGPSDPSRKVYEEAQERINLSGAKQMPPEGEPTLTAAEHDTLETWLADGAPSNDAGCGGGG